MTSTELVWQLRTAGDPLHILAAERITQLEAIARLNAETIRSMQRAVLEAASSLYRSSTTNGDSHAHGQPDPPRNPGQQGVSATD